jgi:hypothetical protein
VTQEVIEEWEELFDLAPWSLKPEGMPTQCVPVQHDLPQHWRDHAPNTAQAASQEEVDSTHSGLAYSGVSVHMGAAPKPLPAPKRLVTMTNNELKECLKLLQVTNPASIKSGMQKQLYDAMKQTCDLKDVVVDMTTLGTCGGEFAEMDSMGA